MILDDMQTPATEPETTEAPTEAPAEEAPAAPAEGGEESAA